MENDPDHIHDEDDAAIGDETDDVDVDGDDLDEDDDLGETQGGVDPTKDIMDDDSVTTGASGKT